MDAVFEEHEPTSIDGLTSRSRLKGLSGHRIVADRRGRGIFVIGGWNPDFLAPNSETQIDRRYVREIWKFNTSTRRWTELRCENPPLSLASHCAVDLGDGTDRLLIFGGSLSMSGEMGNSNETYVYSTSDERWQRLSTTGRPPNKATGHWFGQAMAKRGKYVYVASGRADSADRTEIHRLDLQTLTWEELEPTAASKRYGVVINEAPRCRVRHEIIVDERDRVYLLGGAVDFIGESFDLEKIPYFDVGSRRWEVLKTIPDVNGHGYPAARSCFGAAILDDSIYVIGGHSRGVWDGQYDHPAVRCVLDDVWRLDLSTGQWRKYAIRLPQTVWFHSVDLDEDGVLYVYGGCVEESYDGERSTRVLSTKLTVPTLKRLAWDEVRRRTDLSDGNTEGIATKLGLPMDLIGPKLGW